LHLNNTSEFAPQRCKHAGLWAGGVILHLAVSHGVKTVLQADDALR